jgi:hypothetical protein
MATDPIFFRDLALVFLAAVVGGGLAWLTRQPLILGYVVGGILISPFTPGPAVQSAHTFGLFAEIGVMVGEIEAGSGGGARVPRRRLGGQPEGDEHPLGGVDPAPAPTALTHQTLVERIRLLARLLGLWAAGFDVPA